MCVCVCMCVWLATTSTHGCYFNPADLVGFRQQACYLNPTNLCLVSDTA